MGQEEAKQTARSSLLLIMGNLASTGVGFVSVLVVARLLGPSQYGIYTLATTASATFIIFTSWGINTSITRFSAYYQSRGQIEVARRKIQNSITFFLIIGSVLALTSYLIAPYFSTVVFHRSDIAHYVQLCSLSILGQVVLSASVLALVAWRASGYASISNVIQSVSKAAISISLVVLNLGVLGALIGYVLSAAIAGCFSLSSLFILKLNGVGLRNLRFFFKDIIEQIRFGLTIEVANVLNGFVSSTYIVILLSEISNNSVVGWYQAAYNFTLVISLVSNGFTSALYPSFSRLYGQGLDVRPALEYATKYVAFALAPIIFLLIFSSKVIVEIVYGETYLPASIFLTILTIGFIPYIFGFSVFGPFFQSNGKTLLNTILALSSVPPILILAPVLGKDFGPYGLIYAVIISDVITCTLTLLLSKRYLSATINYTSSLKIIAVSLISAIPSVLISQLSIPAVPLLTLQVVTFLVLYLTLSPLIRSINSADIERLSAASAELGPASRLIGFILRYEKRLITIVVR